MKPEHNIPKNEMVELVRRRIRKLHRFYVHTAIFFLGLSAYVLKEYFGRHLDFPPFLYLNHFIMGFWAFVYALQAMHIFLMEIVFGSSWEERKIRKMTQKESEKQIWK